MFKALRIHIEDVDTESVSTDDSRSLNDMGSSSEKFMFSRSPIGIYSVNGNYAVETALSFPEINAHPLRKVKSEHTLAKPNVGGLPLGRRSPASKRKLELSIEVTELQKELHAAQKTKIKYMEAARTLEDNERLAQETLFLDLRALNQAESRFTKLATALHLI